MKSLFFILILIFSNINIYSQTVNITSTTKTVDFNLADDEKVIKASASAIKSKTNLGWSTTIHGVKTNWNVVYSSRKEYSLSVNNKIVYTAMDIAAIRAKYLAILLGEEKQITNNSNSLTFPLKS